MVGFITGALSVELEIFLVVLALEDAHQAAIDWLFECGGALHCPHVGEPYDAADDLSVGFQSVGVGTAEGIEDVVHLPVAHLRAQHLLGFLYGGLVVVPVCVGGVAVGLEEEGVFIAAPWLPSSRFAAG